jgi:hypothetical protein
MYSSSNNICWEIMNCNNPETPCWEIAKKLGTFHYVSNTCRDCILYILDKETPLLSKENMRNIVKQRDLVRKNNIGFQTCI